MISPSSSHIKFEGVAVWGDSHMGFSSPFPLDQAHKERSDVEVNAVSPQAGDFVPLKDFGQTGAGKDGNILQTALIYWLSLCDNSDVNKIAVLAG